jgi:hypothetical protein
MEMTVLILKEGTRLRKIPSSLCLGIDLQKRFWFLAPNCQCLLAKDHLVVEQFAFTSHCSKREGTL